MGAEEEVTMGWQRGCSAGGREIFFGAGNCGGYAAEWSGARGGSFVVTRAEQRLRKSHAAGKLLGGVRSTYGRRGLEKNV